MVTVERYREVKKELAKLPPKVRADVEIAIGKLVANPTDPTVVHKAETGWKSRKVYVSGHRGAGGTFRMAWEVIAGEKPADLIVIIWMVGAHEGFYKRLAQRARQ